MVLKRPVPSCALWSGFAANRPNGPPCSISPLPAGCQPVPPEDLYDIGPPAPGETVIYGCRLNRAARIAVAVKRFRLHMRTWKSGLKQYLHPTTKRMPCAASFPFRSDLVNRLS